jgi:hypothetical protein
MIYTLDGSPAVDVLARCIPELGHGVPHVALKTVFLGVFNAHGKVCSVPIPCAVERYELISVVMPNVVYFRWFTIPRSHLIRRGMGARGRDNGTFFDSSKEHRVISQHFAVECDRS